MHKGKHRFSYRNSAIQIVEFIDFDSEEIRYVTDVLPHSYDSLDSLISDYKRLIDKRLEPKRRKEEDDFDERSIYYKDQELELERDIVTGKVVGGKTYDLYSERMFRPLVRFKGKLKDLRRQFEKYVDDYEKYLIK